MPAPKQLVDALWHRTYQLLQNRLGAHTIGPALGISQRFDQEVLNDIAQLKIAEDMSKAIENVQGKLAICQSTGFIGSADADELYDMLAEIQKGDV